MQALRLKSQTIYHSQIMFKICNYNSFWLENKIFQYEMELQRQAM